MTLDKITSSIGSSLLFQSLTQNLDDYHQGANKLGRIVYQCALAKITASSVSMAMAGVEWLSESHKNFVQQSLITSLAIPVILNIGDIFTLPIVNTYRKEIFSLNSHFSTVCFAVMHVAIATLCLGTSWTLGLISLAALHVGPTLERLGLPATLSSVLSLSNKLIGSVYGLYSGNCVVQGVSFFQTIRSIEKLSLLYFHNKEAQLDALRELQKLPPSAANDLSCAKVIPARYHLVRDDIIEVPPLPSQELPNLSVMINDIDWENNESATQELKRRLHEDAAWCDQWGSSVELPQAICYIQQGAKNFTEYMATCPSRIRDRAMWILINLEKKPPEDRIPYLIEMARHMHYCIAGKNAQIEATYGILFDQIDGTSLESKIHQIMQEKREDLFKNICRKEVENVYEVLTKKIQDSQETMNRYEPQLSDTLPERVQKCLYYIDSYVSHKLWIFRSMIVEKFKEKYMNDVHVYNELKNELTSAMKQQKTPNGFILTRFVHWLVIKIHEWILSTEVMNIRIESFNRMFDEYNAHFIFNQLQENLQNEVLHPIDHQLIVEWLQSDLTLKDIGVIYEEDPTQTPTQKIKESYLIYLLVRIGLLEVSSQFAKEYVNV